MSTRAAVHDGASSARSEALWYGPFGTSSKIRAKMERENAAETNAEDVTREAVDTLLEAPCREPTPGAEARGAGGCEDIARKKENEEERV